MNDDVVTCKATSSLLKCDILTGQVAYIFTRHDLVEKDTFTRGK